MLKKTIKSITFLGSLILLCAAASTGTDYENAVPQIQVNNAAQHSLEQVNNILCIVGLTDYQQFTNAGPTLALVNQNICNQAGNPGQQAGADGASTTGAPNYFNIAYDATRANNSSPENVVFWITGNIGGGNGGSESVLIEAVLNVYESPTVSNPYGLFDFTFIGYSQSDKSLTNPHMQGYIRSEVNSGVVQLVFYQQENGQPGAQENKVILIGAGTDNGYGKVIIPQDGNSLTNYTLAYNSGYLFESSPQDSAICYDRNSTTNYTYQYGVYNSGGSTLVNTGTGGNGVGGYPVAYLGVQGFLSYYGLSLPTGSSISSGAAVQYQDPKNGYATKSGTIYQAGGRMSQYTAESLTFGQIQGVPISLPLKNGQGSNLISWAGNHFVFVGRQSCGSNGCVTIPQASPYPDFNAESFANSASISINQNPGQSSGTGSVNLYLNGLGAGGSTQVTLFESCSYDSVGPVCDPSTYVAPKNESSLVVWQNSVVTPTLSSSSQVLYCFQNCPYESNGQWMNGNPQYDRSGGFGKYYITYTFYPSQTGESAYSLILTDESSSYKGSTITSTDTNYIGTGPLLTYDQYSAITGGNIDNPPNIESLYQAGNYYYQWQTGGLANGNSYNYYTGIKDSSGNLLSVVSPMTLIYESTSGSSYFFQYSGPGNLQGIPGACYNESDNSLVDSGGGCGNVGTVWKTLFNIPDGLQLRDFNGNQYLIKQLFTSQVIDSVGSNQDTCGANDIMGEMSNAQNLVLPESSGYGAYNYVKPDNGPAPTGLVVKVINGLSQ